MFRTLLTQKDPPVPYKLTSTKFIKFNNFYFELSYRRKLDR